MKHRIVLVLALAFVLAVGGMAMAQQRPPYVPEGNDLPSNATQVEKVWELLEDGETWDTSTNAQAFNSGGSSGHCNRACWDAELETHVSVAQWINYNVDGTRKDWRVLKPGTYGANSVTARIRSNNDVQISFWAEDPTYLNDDVESPPIAAKYGYSIGENSGNNINNVSEWVSGFSAADPLVFTIRYEDGLADELVYRLWQQIEVTNAHRSSDYHGFGGLLICVTNLKYWVDPETGGFNGLKAAPVS